jgi:ABC-type Fe3+-siderophore transport system permease subunit
VLSAGTALIAAWLAVVLAAVLPSRSPGSIPIWAAIMLLAIMLVVVGVAWLARPSRLLARALRVAGLAVGIVGGWLIAAWLVRSGDDGEGYELAIGAWFVLHGAAALLAPSGWAARRRSRRTRASTSA